MLFIVWLYICISFLIRLNHRQYYRLTIRWKLDEFWIHFLQPYKDQHPLSSVLFQQTQELLLTCCRTRGKHEAAISGHCNPFWKIWEHYLTLEMNLCRPCGHKVNQLNESTKCPKGSSLCLVGPCLLCYWTEPLLLCVYLCVMDLPGCLSVSKAVQFANWRHCLGNWPARESSSENS